MSLQRALDGGRDARASLPPPETLSAAELTKGVDSSDSSLIWSGGSDGEGVERHGDGCGRSGIRTLRWASRLFEVRERESSRYRLERSEGKRRAERQDGERLGASPSVSLRPPLLLRKLLGKMDLELRNVAERLARVKRHQRPREEQLVRLGLERQLLEWVRCELSKPAERARWILKVRTG